jgi:tetratricopeptide (TPR) repeat protein
VLKPTTSHLQNRWTRLVAVLAIVGSVAAARHPSFSRGPLQRLHEAAALEQNRFVEARLSGGWPYAPFGRPVSPREIVTPLVVVAARVLTSSKASSQVRGISYLFLGDSSHSITEFQRSPALSNNADAWCDLAAAFLTRGEKTGDANLTVDALAASDRALELDAGHAAAHFNRALALERIGLLSDARRELQRSIQSDPESEWVGEALWRIHSIPLRNSETAKKRAFLILDGPPLPREQLRTLVRGLPQALRAYGESLCMCAWASAIDRGDSATAAERLDVARAIGRELRLTAGESLLAESVAAADRATTDRNPGILAKAYLDYCRGRQKHSQHDAIAAERNLRAAARGFTVSGSPMALVARYYVGSTLHAQLRLVESLRLLSELASQIPESAGYRALTAQIGWERGLCLAARGTPAAGLAVLAASRDLFARLGELDNCASVDAILADIYDFVGDAGQAWKARRSALIELEQSGDIQRCIVALEGAAGSRVRGGEWIRAAALIDAGSTLALRTRDAYYRAHLLSLRSIIDTELSDPRRSAADLAAARESVKAIRDEMTRRQVSADVAMADGYALRISDARTALIRFTQALVYYRTADYRVPIPRVLLERSRVLRSLGRFGEAARDLEAGIVAMENLRRSMPNVIQRAAAFAGTGEIFDDAVSLAIQEKQDEYAFELSERGRARALVDTYLGVDRPLIGLREIQSLLATDSAIIEYSVGAKSISAFIITPHRFKLISIKATEERLRHAASLDNQTPELDEILLVPVRPFLSGVSTLVVVADRFLASVSFGALTSRANGRKLIDDYVIVQSPSANVAIMASRVARRRIRSGLVAIAATDLDFGRHPYLSRLDAAESEVQGIAALLPNTEVIVGKNATPANVVEAICRSRHVHYAGHALADPLNPAASRLLLSGGDLSAGEIAALKLPNSPTVVLAACRTARANESRDGVSSLAVAFLMAGAPVVVASPIDVDDRAVGDLVGQLYRNLLKRGDPAEALHDTLAGHHYADPGLARITAFGGSSRVVRTAE